MNEEQSNYIFSTGLDSNLSGLTEEIHQTAAEMPQEAPLFDAPPIDSAPQDDTNIPSDFSLDDNENKDEEQSRRLGKAVAESGGKALARAVDRVASIGLALIAHGEAKDYRADRTELADLQEAFAEFMAETGFQMSPGWNLMIALMSIYGFKAMGALQDRRAYEHKQLNEGK